MPGQHGSGCSCSSEPKEVGGGFWLIDSIDRESVSTSGEAAKDSGRLLFRSPEEKLDDSKRCESGDADDPEIIISLALTSPTKLTSISVIGGADGSSPRTLRLFANADLGSFNTVHDIEPTQTIELAEDFCGAIQYPLKVAKFSQLLTLTLHFPSTSMLTLHWIGLKGIASGDKRQAVVTVYEARPNLSDHSIPDTLKNGSFNISYILFCSTRIHSMSFLQSLLSRNIPAALEAANAAAKKSSLPVEVFVARQASERAYLIFKTSVIERAEALTIAGEVIFGKPKKFPGRDVFKTEHDRMVATESLLHAAKILGNSMNPTRDYQIAGRACGYRLLLSPAATELYPFMTSIPGFRAAELSMLLNLEISTLGPRGPLEDEAEGKEDEFQKWSEKRQKIVHDWELRLVKEISQLIGTEISQLIGTDRKVDKSRILRVAVDCFRESKNVQVEKMLSLLQGKT